MLTISLFASAPLLLASGASGNLIVNGSFENPAFAGSHITYFSPTTAITGWTVSGPGTVVIVKAPDAGFATGNSTFNFAHHGDYYLDLSGNGQPHATISQTVTTVFGQAYELSFWIGASNQNAPAATIGVRLDGIGTFVNAALTPSAPLTNINWTRYAYTFIADSTSTTLRFRGLSTFDDNTSFVDGCMIEEVPAPASALLLLGGAAGYRRRRLQ